MSRLMTRTDSFAIDFVRSLFPFLSSIRPSFLFSFLSSFLPLFPFFLVPSLLAFLSFLTPFPSLLSCFPFRASFLSFLAFLSFLLP